MNISGSGHFMKLHIKPYAHSEAWIQKPRLVLFFHGVNLSRKVVPFPQLWLSQCQIHCWVHAWTC